MNRKVLIILVAVAVLLSGCGRQEEPAASTKNQTIVGFSQVGAESDWRRANTISMQDAFTSGDGFEMIFENAMQKQDRQLLAIRNFIQQGVDYIIVAPVKEGGWESVLLEAKEAGIPLIVIDRQFDVDDDSLFTCWIGSDFLKEAEMAVDWLNKETEKRNIEEVNILHIKGTEGSTAQVLRTKGLEAAVEKNDSWNIVGQLYGEFTEAKGYEAVKDYLKTGQQFNVLYSENDNMTFGAMKALDEAGISYGAEGDVIIITFDAVRRALKDCLDGKINLCVECNPLHGNAVKGLIRDYEAGKNIDKYYYIDETCFTRDDLSEEFIANRSY